MKKSVFAAVLVVLLVLTCGAAAAVKIGLKTEDGKAYYDFALEGQEFAILEYTAPDAKGKMVVYGEDGAFAGEILLPWSGKGGNVKLTVKNLKNSTVGHCICQA